MVGSGSCDLKKKFYNSKVVVRKKISLCITTPVVRKRNRFFKKIPVIW
jgi:hypothetical protein